MALSGDRESDSAPPEGYGNFMEVDGKMQPVPKGVSAKRTIMEKKLWEAQVKGGALQHDTIGTLKLTNLRAMDGNQSVMLKDCEIVVTNKVTQSGTTTGNIEFIKQGVVAIIFARVRDPDSLAAMAASAKESVLAAIKEAEEEHRAEQEAIARMKAQGINDITCSRCTVKNPLGSKFCRGCGSPI